MNKVSGGLKLCATVRVGSASDDSKRLGSYGRKRKSIHNCTAITSLLRQNQRSTTRLTSKLGGSTKAALRGYLTVVVLLSPSHTLDHIC